jgi:predicted phosphohydrolase
MRLVLISDTHNKTTVLPLIPEGDILIHAGDISSQGDIVEIATFNHWLGSQPHSYKIVIAGNHDFCFQRTPGLARATLNNAIYLQDSAVTIKGLQIYGSPWQPWFFKWAFNLPRGSALENIWSAIPDGCNVLVRSPAWHFRLY